MLLTLAFLSATDMSRNLLRSLINVSEKAANIARICRANDQLLALLVQEKSSDEANPRFVHDFKTLADVLIQETVRHDIGNEVSVKLNFSAIPGLVLLSLVSRNPRAH